MPESLLIFPSKQPVTGLCTTCRFLRSPAIKVSKAWILFFPRKQVHEDTSQYLLPGAQDQRLGAEQDQLPCGSTGTSSSNCQETETCVVRACPTPRQPLRNHPSGHPRSGELRTQKSKSHLVRTQSLNVLPLKPGVGQYIAIHATLTARDFFLAYFYISGPFTCIFSKTSPDFPLCWLWLTHGSCVGPQNKIGHPAGCRVPTE